MKFKVEMTDGEIEYMDEKRLKEYALGIFKSNSDNPDFPGNLDPSLINNQIVVIQWARDHVLPISDNEYHQNTVNKNKDYMKVSISVSLDLDLFLSVNEKVCPVEIERIIKKALDGKIHNKEDSTIVRQLRGHLLDRLSEVVIDKEDLSIDVRVGK